jgi:hypothetical protein
MVVVLRRPGSVSRHLEAMRHSTLRMMRKNRALLPDRWRGRYRRWCIAGIHADYAKWYYRNGERGQALGEVARMLLLAPRGRGRLALGLFRDILLGRPL